jgi:hypothetical protein
VSEGNGRAKGLRAADLFNAPGRAPVAVELPGMGVAYVRAISASKRDRWEAVAQRERERAQRDKGGGRAVRVRSLLVAMCACTEDGEPLFGEDAAEQLADVEGGAEWVDRLFEAAARLNRIGAGAEAEAEKNSAGGGG